MKMASSYARMALSVNPRKSAVSVSMATTIHNSSNVIPFPRNEKLGGAESTHTNFLRNIFSEASQKAPDDQIALLKKIDSNLKYIVLNIKKTNFKSH